MQPNFILSILALTLLICCGTPNETNGALVTEELGTDSSNYEVLFDDYLAAIPKTKLPLDLKCEIELEGSTLNFDHETIHKFGYENSKINSKLAETENFTAIIYLYPADINLPIIQTTDKKGNKISQLKIYDKWCGQDEFSWGTSWAKITDELTIILSDSAITYKRNDKDEIIESSKNTEVRHRIFQIDKSGRIIENTIKS